MFSNSAQFYDALYSFKDYKRESDEIKNYILQQDSNYKTVLNVACGSGNHDQYLKDTFQLDGVDLDEEFIKIAKTKNKSGQYFVADMINLNLCKRYDVVLCLFSSIGYVQTYENLVSTLKSFRNHINDNGCIIVEPWITPEQWKGGRVDVLNAEKDNIKITRMTRTENIGKLSILNFHYLIGSKDGVEYKEEKHKLGLYSVDEMKQAFNDAGLNVSYDPQGITGRGMYTGRLL